MKLHPLAIGAIATGGGLIAIAALSPYRLVVGFKSGFPYPLVVRKVGTQQNGDPAFLERESADAFEAMQTAAMYDGVSLYISSAFRNFAHQALLYVQNKVTGIQTAIPGFSNHQQGVALDIDVGGDSYATNRTYLWLRQHAAEFGFRFTVAGEPWHISRGNG